MTVDESLLVYEGRLYLSNIYKTKDQNLSKDFKIG